VVAADEVFIIVKITLALDQAEPQEVLHRIRTDPVLFLRVDQGTPLPIFGSGLKQQTVRVVDLRPEIRDEPVRFLPPETCSSRAPDRAF